MNMITQILDTIVKSNTFNFIVMILILALIVKKINLSDKLNTMKDKVKQTIKDAENEKLVAENQLLDTQKSVNNLDNEIKDKLHQAEKNAENFAKDISKKTNEKIENLQNNVEKVIKTEEKAITNRLTLKAAKASTELAKKHIKDVLNTHPELHEKYIKQSIEELG